MRTIVPPSTQPAPTTPAPPTPTSGPATCAPWCINRAAAHAHAYTAHGPGQPCRSTVHRIDSLGGGSGPDHTAAATGIYLQAERQHGPPPAYILGIELGGTEFWTRLHAADLRRLITAARTLLAQTTAA